MFLTAQKESLRCILHIRLFQCFTKVKSVGRFTRTHDMMPPVRCAQLLSAQAPCPSPVVAGRCERGVPDSCFHSVAIALLQKD